MVSLPQTAFTNTGAGVKSSVLFLKKNDAATTEYIRRTKQSLQDDLTLQNQLVEKTNLWEKEKQALLKPLKAKDDETKAKRQVISDEYNDKLNAFKEELEECYQAEKQARLPDYPIFMAIAEHIGYDATGRTIPQNDLPEITEELRWFIEAIETGQDSFFV